MADPVQDAAERLYGLPLEDFTRERDALARELRRAKDRDAAAAVAALKKPSLAAWTANRLARERRDLVDELLAAGAELREAQEDALAGGGADALRDAGAAERAAVDALVAAARDLRPAGRAPTESTLERLRDTLHAAAADEAVREALAAGRLVEDAEATTAWGLLEAASVAGGQRTERPTPRPTPRRRPRDDKERREAEERAAAERENRERRQRLESELREARAERRSRDRELGRAEREAERAAERLQAAIAAVEEARTHEEETRAELEAAREAAETARDEVARLEEQLD
jgi:hypothetical protein